MRTRSTAFCISAAALLLTGCGGEETPPLQALVEAEVRAATPAGWQPVAVELGEFEEAGVVNRSNVRFELSVTPDEPMAVLIETVDGVNIVQPVPVEASDDEDLSVSLFGSARVIEPAAGQDEDTIVRIEWRTGSSTLFETGDHRLKPIASLEPYTVEGTEEAQQLRTQRADRVIAEEAEQEKLRLAKLEQEKLAELEEERIRSRQRLERQSLVEGEQIEMERIAAEAKLEKLRLARITLDQADPGRWIDGAQFATEPTDPLTDIVLEGRVNLPPGRVFGMLTTDSGVRSFMGMPADIELRIGGKYFWDTTPRDNTTGLYGGRILAYRAGELLVVGMPPQLDYGATEPSKSQVAFILREVTNDDGSIATAIRIVQSGMPSGGPNAEAWDKIRFDARRWWTTVVANMQQAIATGRVER